MAFSKVDLELHQIYQEYYKDRKDFGHEKDSLLPLFETKLKDALGKKEYYGRAFDSLTKSKQVTVLTSKDKKLQIYSWDTFNMGSWKQYNSMYQYENNNQLYTGFLSEKDLNTGNYINFSDGYHFEIIDIDTNFYLVKGYGTHGHGHEFYTMRLLSFREGKLQDCISCFNGEDRLVLYKSRSQKDKLTYDLEKKEISFLEHKEDEDMGVMRPTGKKIVLSFNNGQFKSKN
ncbi:hypothetical protein V6246_05165 [Algibacter sp. TI.3.09]|uniref:hypothetical protein n=1 Tax=Algibacter sp. TI.3.09 TaxID=3121298 RepID=UPI00311F02BE